MKKLLLAILLFIGLLGAFILLASDILVKPGERDMKIIGPVNQTVQLDYNRDIPIRTFADEPVSESENYIALNVMTYNIAYGYGWGSEGPGYKHRDWDLYERRLKEMAALIDHFDVDILLIQEIDFKSSRSADVDQLKFLLEHTGLKYGAYAPSWTAGYVPFPFGSIRNQFGRVNSGGAVLSRYPISSNKVTLLPKPDSNPWWYNAFYLYRYSQWVDIELPEIIQEDTGNTNKVTFVNHHLEAFDIPNKEEHADIVLGMVSDRINDPSKPSPVIFGGDINSVPAQAQKKSNFVDSDDDYEDDYSLDRYYNFPGYRELISLEDYYRSEYQYYTFPAHMPDRRLDYLFVRDDIPFNNVKFLLTGELSDHIPVMSSIYIPKAP